jgi:hypothetical protein
MRVIVFILCLAVFVAGMVTMAYSFPGDGGLIGEVFVAGVLLSSAAIFVPMSILRWLDRA